MTLQTEPKNDIIRIMRYSYTNITCLSIKGFHRKTTAYDKFNYSGELCEEKQMKDLFEQCDIMSLYVQQAEETMFLVNDKFLNKF
ncbi:hypothetical protein [Labilibaculum manganireducens]|uniref:hypothetical protein n=1 Tax=Labilibaculum manganireducens TaxID=1940525 RepID=UPI0029F57D0F|nr:hypothetical protein [Labilibaculum manganireducens]